jgi:hypothetical protein
MGTVGCSPSPSLHAEGFQICREFVMVINEIGQLWVFTPPARVLKNALGACVMDESIATDESFPHEHLTPCAEAIG